MADAVFLVPVDFPVAVPVSFPVPVVFFVSEASCVPVPVAVSFESPVVCELSPVAVPVEAGWDASVAVSVGLSVPEPNKCCQELLLPSRLKPHTVCTSVYDVLHMC